MPGHPRPRSSEDTMFPRCGGQVNVHPALQYCLGESRSRRDMMNYTYKRGLHSDTGLEVDHAGVVEPEHKLGLPHVVPDGQKWIFEGSFQACKIIY